MSVVLIHSPLVGPASWRPTARVLERRGIACAVPGLPGDSFPAWRDWAESIGAVVRPDRPDEPVVLVGHSAAGLLLPAVARRLHARALVLVDARIPPDVGTVRPADDEFLTFVSTREDDGVLPPWSRWWGDEIAERLVPDAVARAEFEADLPRLALQWFDDSAAVPPWRDLPAGYVQLSAPYAEEAGDARSRGWPVETVDGTHLSPVTDPDAVADAIAAVLDCLVSPAN